MRLPDGGAIKLTTGEYFTPLGRTVHDVGLTPEILVERTEGEEGDPELEAALAWIRDGAPIPVGAGR